MRDVAEVLSIRHYKAGYEVRTEKVLTHFEDMPDDHTLTLKNAYAPNGDWIGDSKTAHNLCKKHGIAPEKANPEHCICSIGFCKRNRSWCGWSHRAIHCFKIGDIVKEGDIVTASGWTDEYLEEHPEADLSLLVGFEAKTLEDCKKMAIAFAEGVS